MNLPSIVYPRRWRSPIRTIATIDGEGLDVLTKSGDEVCCSVDREFGAPDAINVP